MRVIAAIIVTLAMAAWAYWHIWGPKPEPAPGTEVTSADITYYQQIFTYAMDNLQPGNKFDWKSSSIRGTIAASAPYVSKSGYTCRNYSENYQLGAQAGARDGIVCHRKGREGWCRLKKENALTCAMEQRDLFAFQLPGMNIAYPAGVGDVDFDAPDINTNVSVGGIGNVDTTQHSHGSGNIKQQGMGIANSVTGAAGKAAAATGNAVKSFLNEDH